MGIFRRRVAPAVTADDQSRALELLRSWEHAQSHGEWVSAAQRMATLGDWGWWLALAKLSSAQGNFVLVGQVACFVTQAKAMGVLVGSGFGPLAAAVHRAFDEVAVDGLAAAPGDLIIQDGSAGRLDAETVRSWASGRIQNNMH